MATGQGWGNAGQGGFLRILGIVYLVKLIRQRRQERHRRAESQPRAESQWRAESQGSGDPGD
jgi:hypothetical protein